MMATDVVKPKWALMAEQLVPSDLRDLTDHWDGLPDSVMQLFFDLMPKTRDAIERGDDRFACAAFAFAEWCLNQAEDDLWNGAGVCFYEHLFDGDADVGLTCAWLSDGVFAKIDSLLEVQNSRARADEIRAVFRARRHSRAKEVKAAMDAAERAAGMGQ